MKIRIRDKDSDASESAAYLDYFGQEHQARPKQKSIQFDTFKFDQFHHEIRIGKVHHIHLFDLDWIVCCSQVATSSGRVNFFVFKNEKLEKFLSFLPLEKQEKNAILQPLQLPNLRQDCEGTLCASGCCPFENWFCCQDGLFCAVSEEYCKPYE